MNLADKEICSGCAACHDACAKGAISMVADAEGFLYPQIDESKCVNCGLCRKVCPSINRGDSRKPLAVYAAKAKDTELRLASSSGGMFSLLARQVLGKGGKVYGAAFDKRDWSVEHIGVANEEGLAELRGSKYLQSRTAGIYRKVKAALQSGIPVLFTGTPCQIAALRAYLGLYPSVSTANLYLVDVVCHGVPSPIVWQKYLKQIIAEHRSEVKRIAFRDKRDGWKRYSTVVEFNSGQALRQKASCSSYIRAFLNELCNRPSCHNCQCRELRSGSDITIADFWGIGKYMPEMDDDKGTSLVLVNSDKGLGVFDEIRQGLNFKDSTCEMAIAGNPALVRSPNSHRKRAKFFTLLENLQFDRLVNKMLQPPLSLRIRRVIGRALRGLGVKK